MRGKQSLAQKQALKQTASMQTVLFMKMLEMPNSRLEDEVRKALEENPALEIDPSEGVPQQEEYEVNEEKTGDEEQSELQMDEVIHDDDFNDFYNQDEYESDQNLDYDLININSSKDDKVREWVVVNDFSLQESLMAQLGVLDISEQDKKIAAYIAGNLDDSGYLQQDNKTIAGDLLFTYNIQTDPGEVERILTTYIQELDPPGIGARNLRECLLIQLKRKKQGKSIKIAYDLIDCCFEEFTRKHYDKIMDRLNISEPLLKKALAEIQKLDPRPADMQTREEQASSYITPDFTITNDGEQLTLFLNMQYIPKLRVNNDFKKQYYFLKSERSAKIRAEAEKFIKNNVDNAINLINTLSQRELTLHNVMYSIMRKQEAYFLSGNDADLKPMVLKDIASEVGIDISTVSRVSNSKYVQTPFGIIPVKHLFSESIGSDDVSSKEVKSMIAALIEEESKLTPLTDEQLREVLTGKGYVIARRTVAKYREQAGFPVARLRKEL